MSSTPFAPPIETIKATMQAIWSAGDFGRIARTVEADADALVARLDLPAGTRVLDLACGTGNLALPLARAGAIVTGADIAANSLAQARQRAEAEALTLQFDEADAEALPYPDAAFDAVVSMFGAMFAPRPERVVSEMARVLRPGGRLLMANWNPDSFTGALFRASARLAPPPPNLPSPLLWGDDAIVRKRLAEDFLDIRTTVQPLIFDMPMPPAEVVTFYREFYGPTKTTFSRLDPAGQQTLAADLEALWTTHNRAADPTRRTRVPNQYLEISAVRR